MSLLVVLCTFPDQDTAQRVATMLVEERLAACVNLVPGVLSIYRWQGNVESAGEVLAILKMTRDTYPQLESRLKELHPYDVPEIVALPADRALEAYAKWVGTEIRMTNGE